MVLGLIAGLALARIPWSYPPWSLPLSGAVLVLTLCYLIGSRRDVWRLLPVVAVSSGVAMAATAGILIGNDAAFSALTNTVYPGQRRVDGEALPLGRSFGARSTEFSRPRRPTGRTTPPSGRAVGRTRRAAVGGTGGRPLVAKPTGAARPVGDRRGDAGRRMLLVLPRLADLVGRVGAGAEPDSAHQDGGDLGLIITLAVVPLIGTRLRWYGLLALGAASALLLYGAGGTSNGNSCRT